MAPPHKPRARVRVGVLLGAASLAPAGCGRVGFDPLGGRSVDAAAAVVDAALAVSGCADGTREGFVDQPDVASCAATWVGAQSLRTPPTGSACGDALSTCAVPADACAAGWHICGRDGDLAEVVAIGNEACQAAGGTGRFSAAMSHCAMQNFGTCDPTVGGVLPCFTAGWCGEPVCCGNDCQSGVCVDGVFPGATQATGPGAPEVGQGCADLVASQGTGVMCCRD